jgi:multiple antibiotic resistance protein
MDLPTLKNTVSVFLILFSIIDIVGSLPVIINLKEKGLKIESGKASIVSMGLMVVFLYFGDAVLKLFGVDVQSFAIAGSIILFIIAFEMILGVTLFKQDDQSSKATLVPIAFPLIAGAGTMTTIISLKSKFNNLEILIGILLNIAIVYLVLKSSDYLRRKLSPSFIMVLRKMFGIILLAIAVKLFRDNLIGHILSITSK